jgi:hypothetical protein
MSAILMRVGTGILIAGLVGVGCYKSGLLEQAAQAVGVLPAPAASEPAEPQKRIILRPSGVTRLAPAPFLTVSRKATGAIEIPRSARVAGAGKELPPPTSSHATPVDSATPRPTVAGNDFTTSFAGTNFQSPPILPPRSVTPLGMRPYKVPVSIGRR